MPRQNQVDPFEELASLILEFVAFIKDATAGVYNPLCWPRWDGGDNWQVGLRTKLAQRDEIENAVIRSAADPQRASEVVGDVDVWVSEGSFYAPSILKPHRQHWETGKPVTCYVLNVDPPLEIQVGVSRWRAREWVVRGRALAGKVQQLASHTPQARNEESASSLHWITRQELADAAGVDVSTVTKAVNNGKIPREDDKPRSRVDRNKGLEYFAQKRRDRRNKENGEREAIEDAHQAKKQLPTESRPMLYLCQDPKCRHRQATPRDCEKCGNEVRFMPQK